jgi:predicted cupin superfamily sugar epimerase
MRLSAGDVIRLLDLKPHPEGGHFRETFRDPARVGGGRAASTAIYFLLARGESSHWHRIDAVEIWHYYAGAPIELKIASPDGNAVEFSGAPPQVAVPAQAWQCAASLGEWALAGCTVAPGFEFASFEIAPKGWPG